MVWCVDLISPLKAIVEWSKCIAVVSVQSSNGLNETFDTYIKFNKSNLIFLSGKNAKCIKGKRSDTETEKTVKLQTVFFIRT